MGILEWSSEEEREDELFASSLFSFLLVICTAQSNKSGQ